MSNLTEDVKIGEIIPLNQSDMTGWEISGDFLKIDGLPLTCTHPDSVTISGSNIGFTYTIGGGTITRNFPICTEVYTDNDGYEGTRISSFTNPDGKVTGVTYNG